MTNLIEAMLGGSRYALARLVSTVENQPREVLGLMSSIYPHIRGVPSIGVTGPPGAGKSTFVDQLIRSYREADKRVAVIAVDPSSPFSGGAILGDRIRMNAHALDEKVFIRSLGSRGHAGGLSISTGEVIKLFDAAGYDLVIVETVGVGQTEFSVMEVADTVIVILTPESGDTIQTMKAGLLEVADLFVVNKADREGAEKIQRELKNMLQLSPSNDDWPVPVLLTTAHRGVGVQQVIEAIAAHQELLVERGECRKGELRVKEFREIVVDEIKSRVLERVLGSGGPLADLMEGVETGERDPYSAAQFLFQEPARVAEIFARALHAEDAVRE